MSWYVGEASVSEDALRIHAGFVVTADGPPGLEVVTLPRAQVASVIHSGPMEGIGGAYQALARWAEDHGYGYGTAARNERENSTSRPTAMTSPTGSSKCDSKSTDPGATPARRSSQSSAGLDVRPGFQFQHVPQGIFEVHTAAAVFGIGLAGRVMCGSAQCSMPRSLSRA